MSAYINIVLYLIQQYGLTCPSGIKVIPTCYLHLCSILVKKNLQPKILRCLGSFNLDVLEDTKSKCQILTPFPLQNNNEQKINKLKTKTSNTPEKEKKQQKKQQQYHNK